MLKFLRKKGVMKKILWVLAVVIILAFGVFWQADVFRSTQGGPNYAGKIFNGRISFEEFDKQYQVTRIQALLQYGQNLYKIQQFLNLAAETWDRIILLHEADKRRVRISDKDVVQAIQSYPLFQRNGAFDKLLYNDILQYVLKVRARDFEEGLRGTLKISQLFEKITGDVGFTDQEIYDEYVRRNKKIQISYVLFPLERYKDQIPADEAKIREYFSAHQEEFLQPQMINVEFLRIDYPAQAEKQKEPPEAPQEAAEKTPESSSQTAPTPEENEIPAGVRQETKNLAQEISAKLAQNPDLNKIAQEHGLAVETSGSFSMEQPVLQAGWSFPLVQELFHLDVGQITGPVETPQGYQIIKIKEKTEAHTPDFDEVKEQAVELWKMNQAKDLSRQEAQKSLAEIQKEYNYYRLPDFAAITKNFGLEIHQTPVFSRDQYLPKIGISKDFQEAAFALDENNRLSAAVETAIGHCILHLDEIVPVDQKEFEKQKEEFAKTILDEKKNEVFSEFLTQLRLKAQLEDNVSELLADQRF